MTFSEQINNYMDLIGCTGKELAEAAGISTGAVSLYRSGQRKPSAGSQQMKQIIQALIDLSEEHGLSLREQITEDFAALDSPLTVSYDLFFSNMNLMLDLLRIPYVELSQTLQYSPSQISRYLSGQRKPRNIRRFTGEVASYLANSVTPEQREKLAGLFRCTPEEIGTVSLLYEKIVSWCGSHPVTPPSAPIGGFLEKLDSFNLEDYIRAIHFDDIHVPTVPFSLPTSKTYYGIAEFRESELDFLKATAASPSSDDVFVYSDMPLGQMAEDTDFSKKYLFGMAVLLRKGLRIHQIHDIHRPFPEMMLGLEGYIPIYMTGLMSPYYFKDPQNHLFCHLFKVSGAAVLQGMAVVGSHADGQYILSKSGEDIRFGQKYASLMLKAARPLMEIYRADRAEKFRRRMTRVMAAGNRRVVFGGLPLFTASEELLHSILVRCGASHTERQRILAFREESAAYFAALLEHNRITMEVPLLNEQEYQKQPVSMNISELFLEKNFVYTYAEYKAHLAQTAEFAAKFANCTLKQNPELTFRNITFTILYGKCVLISKIVSPTIHFLVGQPEMVKAFEQFVPPMIEEDLP